MGFRSTNLFVIVFLLCIGSVPIVQAVHELRENGSIQFLDMVTDTFVSPIKAQKKRERLLGELSGYLVRMSGRNDQNDTSRIANYTDMPGEEALALAEDLRRNIIEVNRYIADSTHRILTRVDSLVDLTRRLSEEEAEGGQVDTEHLHAVNVLVESMRRAESPADRVVLPVRYFFKYTLFNKKYLRAYEKKMEETSVFALEIRPVYQFARYRLLRDFGDKAIAGKRGWLFYRPGVEYLYRPSVTDKRARSVDYNDKPLVDDPVAAIARFREQLREFGCSLLVVIIPGKPSIYPDLLAPGIVVDPGRPCISRSIDMIAALRAEGVDVADLFKPMLDERLNDPRCGDSVYLRLDTHWRSRGLLCAARTVAAAVRRYPWYADDHEIREYAVDTIVVKRSGDIAGMTKLEDFKIGDFSMRFPTENVDCYRVVAVDREDGGAVISRQPYRDDYRKSRILILGDSFSRIYQTDAPRSAGWIAHLARELSEPLASIVNDGGASTLVRETLSRKVNVLRGKKLVIWEFVERDFRFGAEGWKEVPLSRNSNR